MVVRGGGSETKKKEKKMKSVYFLNRPALMMLVMSLKEAAGALAGRRSR